ncbi:hypothetical protein [Spirosoma koreense]
MTAQEKIIMWLVVIVVFIFIGLLRGSEESALDECSKITVAEPIEVNGSFRRSFTLSYKYMYQGKLFRSSNSLGSIDLIRFGEKHFLSRRYYVKIQCDDPQLTRVLWEEPVPATIDNVPDEGWISLPKK